ncbi:MAG: hypothetical protein QOK43_2162 [Acidimicrobiaceae bacterium]|nr:hypothetical protein [Acidimicrobiaceae bacterium]
MSTVFGLPAHPFLVHFPILSIPIVTLLVAVRAVVPSKRRVLGLPTAVLAALTVVSVQLAVSSGDALEHHVPRSTLLERHTQLADGLRPLSILVLVLVLGAVAFERRPVREPDGEGGPAARGSLWTRRLGAAFAVAALLTGVAATARLVQVGHAGAKATWSKVDMHSRQRPGP